MKPLIMLNFVSSSHANKKIIMIDIWVIKTNKSYYFVLNDDI